MFETLVATTILVLATATASAFSSNQSPTLNRTVSAKSQVLRAKRLNDRLERSKKLTKEIRDRF